MTSELQNQALAALAKVWELSPDVRLGQLLAHLGFLGEAHFNHDLSSIDDDELMAVLQRHRDELVARLSSTPTITTPMPGGGVSNPVRT